jgi:hypothetical protein
MFPRKLIILIMSLAGGAIGLWRPSAWSNGCCRPSPKTPGF